MRFASFPVSLLAVLASYQWHSFGAYGANIEAASSPDLEAEKEEISLPRNALRGNRSGDLDPVAHDNRVSASTVVDPANKPFPLATQLRGEGAVNNKRDLASWEMPTTTFHIKGRVYKKDGFLSDEEMLPGAEVTCFNSLDQEVCKDKSRESTGSFLDFLNLGSFDCEFESTLIGDYYCKVEKGLSFEACHGDHPAKPKFLIKVGTNKAWIRYRYLSDDDGVPKVAHNRSKTEEWYWDEERLINVETKRAFLTAPVCENGASVKMWNKGSAGPKQKWTLTKDDRLESIGCPGLYLHKGGSGDVLDKLLIRNGSYNKKFRQNWLPTCQYGEMEYTSYTSKRFILTASPTGGHKSFNLKDASVSNYNDVKLDGEIILYNVSGTSTRAGKNSDYYTTRGECTPPTPHPVWFHYSCLYHDECFDKGDNKKCNADFLDLLMNQCREFLIEGNTPRRGVGGL